MRKSILAVTAALILALAVRADLLSFLSGGVASGGGGGGGGSGLTPAKTAFVSAYDFDDATDEKSGYALVELNSPLYYTDGPNYGKGVQAGNVRWEQSSLDSAFANTSGSWSYIVRVRGYGTVSTGRYALNGNGGNTSILWQDTSGGWSVKLAGKTRITNIVPSIGTWYFIVASYDVSTSILYVSINGSTYSSGGTSAGTFTTGDFILTGNTPTATSDMDLDFAYFIGGTISQGEVDAMWAKIGTDGTLTYADFSD